MLSANNCKQGRDISSDNVRPEELSVSQNATIPKQLSVPMRKTSLRHSIGRAGNRFSKAVLAALRSSTGEPPVHSKADMIMTEWQSFLSDRDPAETAKEGAFEPLQNMIAEAVDLKYEELRAKGGFVLLADAGESSIKELLDSPAELALKLKEPMIPNVEEITRVSYTKREQQSEELHGPHVCNIKGPGLPSVAPQVSADYRHILRKPQICPADSPNTVQEARSMELQPLIEDLLQHESTPSSKSGIQSTNLGAEIDGDITRTSTASCSRKFKPWVSIPTANGNHRSVSNRNAPNIQANAVQLPETQDARVLRKSRQDSVLPGALQLTQSQEGCATFRNMDEK